MDIKHLVFYVDPKRTDHLDEVNMELENSSKEPNEVNYGVKKLYQANVEHYEHN